MGEKTVWNPNHVYVFKWLYFNIFNWFNFWFETTIFQNIKQGSMFIAGFKEQCNCFFKVFSRRFPSITLTINIKFRTM